MRTTLFWIGTLLAAAAGVLGIVSTNMNAGGVPADVHPVGALAVGVAAIAMLYASSLAPDK